MKCRKILLSIRKNREANIDLSPAILRDSNPYRLLTALELPYRTDIVSMNIAKIASSTQYPATFDKSVESVYPYDGTVETLENNYKQQHIRNLIESSLPDIIKTDISPDGNVTYSIERAQVNDLIFKEVLESFLEKIAEKDISENSKKTLRSRALKVVGYPQYQKNKRVYRPEISLKNTHNFFDSLELRCLKSNNISHFRHLIEARLMLYTGLKIPNLCKITRRHLVFDSKLILYRKKEYPVPPLFIELICSLYTFDEPLFQSNSGAFNKRVLQISNTTNLKGVTPTSIRQTINYICQKEEIFPKFWRRR